MTNGYYIAQLQRHLDEATARGPFALRMTPVANRDATLDDIARDAIGMHECLLAGDYTDITSQKL